jgi:multidrug efflux system membrane fusion protein
MRSSFLIAALILLATLAWVGSGMVGATEDAETVAADLAPPVSADHDTAVPQVRVARLSAERRVATLSVLGQTDASRQVEIKAETSGRVVETGAEEGRPVEGGGLIVRLAMDDRMQRLSRVEANVARWEDRYSGDQRLANRDFTSRQRLLESKAALEDARAAQAAIQLDIERTEIGAPFDGVLASRLAEIGDYVGIGDPVARIVDLDPLVVTANVAESDIGRIHVGLEGTATLVDGRTLKGTVTFIAPVADGVTRTFPVELSFDNPDPLVPQGMTARVSLPFESGMAHRISPALLALDEQGNLGVKLVDDENRVVFHPVAMAGDEGGTLWVEGLPDPATVITVGQEFVRPGQRVDPVDAETIAANTAALAAADRAALEAGRATDATIDSLETGGSAQP